MNKTEVYNKLLTVQENIGRTYTAGYESAFERDNIINKTVDGSGALYLNDVSEIKHNVSVRLHSDTVTDFSNVVVTRAGKNLLKLNSFTGTYGGLSVSYDSSTDIFTINGICTGNGTNQVDLLSEINGTNLKVEACQIDGSISNGNMLIAVSSVAFDVMNMPYINLSVSGNNYSTTSVSNGKYLIFQTYDHDLEFSDYKFKLVCYEVDSEITYTSNADGIINNIKSVSPDMTIFTNASDLNSISVDYWKSCVYDKGRADGNDFAISIINRTVTSVPKEVLEGMTSIAAFAFVGCRQLVSIELPDTLTNIGENALGGTSLKNIDIPATIKQIGLQAFANNSSLQTVTIRATTPPTLGTNAFIYCYRYLKIIVPQGCADAYKAATNWSEYADKIVEGDF